MKCLVLLIALTGCERSPRTPMPQNAGARLERAAIAAGVVADPARLDPVGVFGIAGDQVCIVSRGDRYAIGATVRYDDEQGCTARGSATGRAAMAVDFGNGCKLIAKFDGERVTLPAVVLAQCDRLCTGRASLAAVSAPRLSAAASEAAALRASDGQPLCAS